MKYYNHKNTGLTLADLIVIIALIPLFLVVIVGCYRTTHRGDNRLKCTGNLKSIGQALLLYSNENKGAYPRTLYEPGPVVIPTWGSGAAGRKSINP